MQKEMKYKPSNLLWCPEIPEHWEVKKISHDYQIIGSGTTPTSGNLEYYLEGKFNWLQTGDLNDGLIKTTSKKITQKALDDFTTLRFYDVDSLVIAMYGATIGKTGILQISTTTNQACCVLSKPNEFYSKFVYYWFLVNRNNLIGLSYGGGQPNINQEQIRSLRIQCPPIKEQQNIVTLLDIKSAEIDNLISQKEKLIEKLQEERIAIINQAVTKGLNEKVESKPSRNEWISEMPKTWTAKRIKHIATTFGRIGYRGYQTSDLVNEGEGAITISPSNMKDFEMDFTKCTFLSWEKYDESPEIQIENGDVLFVKTGSTFGKTALVSNLPEKATINPQLLVFKNIKINNEFFLFVLISELIKAQVNTSVIGGTIPTISQEKIGNYTLFVPPIEEQEQIVEEVKKHSDRIKTAVKKIEQEIELIKEYKASLINELVTGKIILN